ncbi:MAG: hypothetical protein AAGC55_26305 [Myxococcota bacterium]
MSKRRQKRRILWVEDSARFELAGLLGPIYASRRYDLTLAENASSAAEYLRHRRFDAMVVDIRIPPGAHRYWLAIYKQRDSDRTNAKLGLELLDWLLGGTHSGTEGRSRIRTAAPARPSWLVSANHIGVFSVESRVEVGAPRDRRGVGAVHGGILPMGGRRIPRRAGGPRETLTAC